MFCAVQYKVGPHSGPPSVAPPRAAGQHATPASHRTVLTTFRVAYVTVQEKGHAYPPVLDPGGSPPARASALSSRPAAARAEPETPVTAPRGGRRRRL